MNAQTVRYQDFSRPKAPIEEPRENIEVLLARAKGQARADGYADGAAEAQDMFDRDLKTTVEALTATIDAAQAQEAARRSEMIEAMRSLLTPFLKAMCPRLAALNMIEETVATVEEAVRAAPDAGLVVEVSPQHCGAVVAALGERELNTVVEAAGDLAPTEARVHWRNGFDAIDTSAAAAAALSLLDQKLGAAAADRSDDVEPGAPQDTVEKPSAEANEPLEDDAPSDSEPALFAASASVEEPIDGKSDFEEPDLANDLKTAPVEDASSDRGAASDFSDEAESESSIETEEAAEVLGGGAFETDDTSIEDPFVEGLTDLPATDDNAGFGDLADIDGEEEPMETDFGAFAADIATDEPALDAVDTEAVDFEDIAFLDPALAHPLAEIEE
ncbi:MAG: hypothetical protein AAF360_00475 [Pseudomonadota bacterium]